MKKKKLKRKLKELAWQVEQLEVVQGYLLKTARITIDRVEELEDRDRNKTDVLTAHLTGHPGLGFDVYKKVKQ